MAKTNTTLISSTFGATHDTIEVIDENNGLWGRLRIREPSLGKASILLTPSQLDEVAAACSALAASMRQRR